MRITEITDDGTHRTWSLSLSCRFLYLYILSMSNVYLVDETKIMLSDVLKLNNVLIVAFVDPGEL
jgi:hypothetical protein